MTLSFKQLFSLLLIASCLFFAASLLQAWTGPTATAPAGNVAAPINVGTTDQVKNAGLSLNALAVFGNGYIQNKLGIATSAPQVALDVAGTLKIGNAGEVCQSVTAGAIRYNSSGNVPQYCDGTSWKNFGSGSTSTSTQSYTTAGTYTFTVPSSFSALTVVVRGAGGGGGAGKTRSGYGPTGGTGGTSSFGANVSATGGAGGPSGTCATQQGADGSGSGGDINKTGGGGDAGSGGLSEGATCSGYDATGGYGGNGGAAVKIYTSSTLTPASQATVVVGAAGTSYGSAASDGSVDIIWQ